MRAARFHGPGDVRIDDVPDPGAPRPGWVRVRVEACGICGTDMEEYRDGPMLIPTTPHPVTGRLLPLTMGHEAVGIVEEVGAGGDAALVGRRVAIDGNLPCGACWWCARAEPHLCESYASLGMMADGGLAEQVLAPATNCLPLNDDVPLLDAVLAEPLAVAARAISRADLRVGETVAIFGCGSVGLLIALVARSHGAGTIIAVDGLDSRQRIALAHGADHAASPADADETIRAATGGRGADVAFEVAGTGAAAEAAVRATRKGGRTILLGAADVPITLNMLDLLMAERTIRASLSHLVNTDLATAVGLLNSGAVRDNRIVSDVITLEDVVVKGFRALRDNPEDHLKIVVTPT